MSNPDSASQLTAGFYALEQNKWRWVARNFAVVLKPPPGSEQTGTRLQLNFFIPEAQMEKLGSMTLSVDIGEVSLISETFTKGGALSYCQDISPALIGPNLLPVVFSFDQALAPSQTDGRELAAVVTEVSLKPIKQPLSSAEAPTVTDDTK